MTAIPRQNADAVRGVSVVICTHLYERRDQAVAAISSCLLQTHRPEHVVVVVDGDHELHRFLVEQHLPVTLLLVNDRSGLSHARNTGLAVVTTEFVAFLDDDATADKDWVVNLAAHFDDPAVLGVGGRSAPEWGSSDGEWFPPELLWAVGCSYPGQSSETSRVRNVFGGCACFRTTVLKNLGGFSASLGRMATGAGGAEETDLCLRAAAQTPGGYFKFDPDAVIHHRVPASRATVRYVLRRSWFEGRSKATMAALHHGQGVLGAERSYVMHQIPRALVSNAIGTALMRPHALRRFVALTGSVLAASTAFVLSRPAAGRQVRKLRDVETSPVRVASVSAHYLPHMGGIETHVREVATRLNGSGLDFTILTTRAVDSAPSERVDGIPVHRHGLLARSTDWCLAPGVFWETLRGDWDVVHVQGVHTFTAPMAMLAALIRRRPYVVTFHTGGHSSETRGRIRTIQWTVLGPLLRRAAELVAVCEYEIDVFSKILKISPDRFTLIRNGAELPPRPEAPAPVPEGTFVVVSIARLERYKGHHLVIEAVAELAKRQPVHLFIVGQGPYEDELRSLVKQRHLEDAVTFTHFAQHRRGELAALIARADVMTLMSEYEAHPVAVMEALGLGRPVVVAATSGLVELARYGWVTSTPIDASPAAVADAYVDAAKRGCPAVVLPTWDQCAARLDEVLMKAVCTP
jgi:glycosyltransferase involved in cell wall biosynthesis/GT2 family glycosyltransferase